jgi:hypothetical protein
MHIFTSITANYLPKAAALAHSVKRAHPEATMHVLLSDKMPDCPPETTSAFDSIISMDRLPIDNRPSWIFKHRLVELCTAVKGAAFQYIADEFGAERILYFDPDIIVCNRLEGIARSLDRHSVVLTPHMTEPESEMHAILENEVSCLRHGVYNLGFIGVRMTPEGRRFIDWWADRLRHLCYDEVSSGLFTDQRWIDLAPAFFEDIAILRDPEYNVATWNVSHRRATGRAPYEIMINGRPLAFYHFSGFDSGAQENMLGRYGAHSPVLFEFREWYMARCEELGQSELGKIDCVYNVFQNGARISSDHRRLYRKREGLVRAFPDPFDTTVPSRSYYHWYRKYGVRRDERAILEMIKAHAPAPALSLARRARSAWRRWSKPAPSAGRSALP